MKKRSAILILALLLTLVVTVSPALAQARPVHVAGVIIAVDAGASQFTVKPRYRDALTVQTSVDTEYFRKIQHSGLEPISFDNLGVGNQVKVAGTWEGEVLQAGNVVVMPAISPPPVVIHGAIAVLNTSNGTMTVEPRTGSAVIVQTFGETEFFRTVQHGRLVPIDFTDLAVEEWVKVQGAWDGDVLNAIRVTVMPFAPAPPPRLVAGSIGELLSESDFSLDHQRREAITVKTVETTKFYRTLGWGRLEPITFGDLAVGDWVAVLGKWDGEVLNADVVTVTRGHGGEAEGVLEAGEVFEADELVDEIDTLQIQP